MKPTPTYDFPVIVRYQVWEEDPAVALFYEGIFAVILNFTVTVMFVPQVDRHVWPPVLPDNVDDVESPGEARQITIALEQYMVTPDPTRAGEEEQVPQVGRAGPETGVVFYVSPEEFAVFSQELAAVAEQLAGIHDYRPISELADLEFARFLLARVIPSAHFVPSNRYMLGRA